MAGSLNDGYLKRHFGDFSDFAGDGRSDSGGCIALVCVELEHGALVELRLVERLVLLGVVWMEGVRHVGADEE